MGTQARFKVAGSRADIAAFADTFEHFCTNHAVPQPVIRAFQIALDEVLTNIVDYGEAPVAEGGIEVALELDPSALHAEIIDGGKAFDPLSSAPPPDLDSALEDRPIGGLGVHLVSTLMDEVTYQRSAGHNHLRLSKRL